MTISSNVKKSIFFWQFFLGGGALGTVGRHVVLLTLRANFLNREGIMHSRRLILIIQLDFSLTRRHVEKKIIIMLR